MRPHLDCRWPRGDAAGERLRPTPPDSARTPSYWVHALWMVNVLLTMIITWWVQYRWRNAPHWTLFLFLWLLVAPLILYLVAALLFPTNQDDVVVTSWRDHY